MLRRAGRPTTGKASSDTSAAPIEIATVRGKRIEPTLDGGVPAGMAGGGEQHGDEDESVHGLSRPHRAAPSPDTQRPATASERRADIAWAAPHRRRAPARRASPSADRRGRRAPSATMSALPSATIASACFGVAISPTVRVAMPTSRFTCSANGTLKPGVGRALRVRRDRAGGNVDVVEARLP